jgi:hypothetical protein
MKNLKTWASSREDRFPKTLLTLSWCRIAEDDGSRDLLSQSQMHVDKWDEVALAAQQRWRWKIRCIGGLWFFVVTHSVVAAHIYREDLPRVTASLMSTSIKMYQAWTHSKNKRQKEVTDLWGLRPNFDWLFTRPSCARAHCLTSPRHARPGPARRGKVSERTCVFLPFSSPPHTCKCIDSHPPFK